MSLKMTKKYKLLAKKYILPNLNIIGSVAIVLILGVVGVKLIFLTQASQLDGDTNSDGVVNISDLSILAAHYGITSGATWSMGDFNNDGGVGLDDLAILAAHYGDTLTNLPAVPSGLSATATSSSTVNLSWTADSSSGGTVTYLIYRNATEMSTTTATTYADSGLTGGDTYSYTIAASNSYGTSSQSGAVDVTTSTVSTVTAGDSKTNCIYIGYSDYSFTSALTAAEQTTGVTFNCLGTFIDATSTWAEWTSPWITGPAYGFTEWQTANPTGTLVIGTDLVPNNISEPSGTPDPSVWEGDCAAGDFNSYATQLAQSLVSAGFGNAVMRMGMEMNGSWEPDYAGTTVTEQQQWAQCFAQEVTTMRQVTGAHFLFDWNVNACVDDDVLSNLYPGDSYVDIIGVDSYDAFCNGTHPTPSAATFQQLASEPDGLFTVTSFAESLGKPMSLPEWGCVATPANGGSGLGDDGFYVAGIGQWVASNDVAFQSYFDTGGDTILPLTSADPNTLAAYQAAF